MNRFYLSIVLVFSLIFATDTHAQILSWREPNQAVCYKIDFKTKHLWESDSKGQWNDVGEMMLDQIKDFDLYEMHDAITPVHLEGKANTYLLVECSGQVYEFDRQRKFLRREDNTFFRGANCLSTQFARKNEIYSFGGYGFWQSTNVITKYNFSAKEWTHVLAHGDIPKALNKSSTVYFPSLDKLFVASSWRVNQTESADPLDIDFGFYQYDFNTDNFVKLGTIHEPIFRDFFLSFKPNHNLVLGRYWLISPYNSVYGYNYDILYIIDMQDDFHCYLWENPARYQIQKYTVERGVLFQAYQNGNQIFLPQAIASSPQNPYKLVGISMHTLLRESKSLGYLLAKPWKESASEVALIALGVIIFFTLVVSVYKWKMKQKKSQLKILLNSNEKQFLDFLNLNYHQGYVSGYQIIAFFGKHKSSPESQRQFRAKLIDGLNKSLGLVFPGVQVLDIQADEKDQRMLTYRLSDTIYEELKKL